MTSQYRHRRTSNPSTVFPTLEPGEIATNTANRQLAVGDAAGGTVGSPLALLALRYFDTRAIYAANDLVYQANVVWRAKGAAGPGAFNPSQWDMLVGTADPQYVQKAGDTMTGALNLPAANPTAGVHATNKTYVDNLVATKASIVSSISPPVGVPDNTLWFESDTGVCYVRYNDGTSTQWVIAAPQIDVSMFIVRTGDTMTGPLVVPGPPTLGGHAANKTYVDTRATVVASDTPPPAPIDNTIWLESDTGLLFIRYNDGTSAQWMSVPGVAGDAVRYDAAQTLTAGQKAQAHSNIGPSALAIQVFTSSGTYTPTLGMTSCIVECLGGGAGGAGIAGTASYNVFGGGGGGGAYARKLATAATIGASQTVTIGAGGAGGGSGTPSVAGGDSSVGSICVAKGAPAVASGQGLGIGGPQAGCVGDYTAPGGYGRPGGQYTISGTQIALGGGGSSLLGFGGADMAPTGSSVTGASAIGRGGGGSGGAIGIAGGVAGGPGSSGVVIITEFA